MANYTVQVKTIIENLTLDDSDSSILDRIDLACPKIFDFDFPCWNEQYKLVLERKILLRYLMKEIGLETVALWKVFLNERLNSIMPYYNQLYLSTVKEYDYTKDFSSTETVTSTKGTVVDVTNTNSVNMTTTNTAGKKTVIVDSDIPQAYVETGGKYASTITENENSGSDVIADTGTTGIIAKTINSGSDVLSTRRSGNNVNISDLIMKYRDTLINIDNMIVADMSDLFMKIY